MKAIFGVLFSLLSTTILFAQEVDIRAYGAHVELNFTHPLNATISQVITQVGSNTPIVKLVPISQHRFTQFLGTDYQDTSLHFTIIWDYQNRLSDTIQVDSIKLHFQTDEELMDMVQEYTFRYFWDFGHPVSGLIRERNASDRVVTMGGSGFGIMAILVGIERQFITREQGYDRINQIVNFLQVADRFKGVFPHWMNGATGRTIPFSQFDDGGDLVETAFLLQGLLTARQYFRSDDPQEELLRQKITELWEAVNWNWYRKQTQKVLFWHWSPNHGFRIDLQIRGWNEAMIIYLLAVASPTHGVPPSLYHDGWANNNRFLNGSFPYGIELPLGPSYGGPLFFAHYSFLGFDPRDKRDQYANYFIQNRNHTLINRAYCIDNPKSFIGYGENAWGITASDDPNGYLAHAPGGDQDNGTITPTAAISSIPYTPEESLAAMRYFYEEKGQHLWGEMGFYDAYNPTKNWVASSYLAIDQGPIINMIENYRSNLLWDLFMSNSEIQEALDKIGFMTDSTTRTDRIKIDDRIRSWPNPAKDFLYLDQTIDGYIIHSLGGKVLQLGNVRTSIIPVSDLPEGVYVIQIIGEENTTLKFMKQ